MILKLHQRFRSKKHNVFTEQVNKITLSGTGDKRIQSINSAKTYGYGMRKDLVCKNEETKCNKVIKRYKIN